MDAPEHRVPYGDTEDSPCKSDDCRICSDEQSPCKNHGGSAKDVAVEPFKRKGRKMLDFDAEFSFTQNIYAKRAHKH
jgi:hypothetical protein